MLPAFTEAPATAGQGSASSLRSRARNTSARSRIVSRRSARHRSNGFSRSLSLAGPNFVPELLDKPPAALELLQALDSMFRTVNRLAAASALFECCALPRLVDDMQFGICRISIVCVILRDPS